MGAGVNADHHDIFDRYLRGALTADDRLALERLLTNEAGRRAFAEHVQWSAALTRAARQLAGHMAELGTLAQAAEIRPALLRPRLTLRRTRQSQRLWRFALAASLSAAATATFLLHALTTPRVTATHTPPVVAWLHRGHAQVSLVRDGHALTAGPGAAVHASDLIEISGGGTAVLHIPRQDTELRMQSGTQAALTLNGGGGTHVHLFRGRMLAHVAPRPPAHPFTVSARHVLATVLGTTFAMAVDENTTRLGVAAGAVRVTHRETATSTVVSAGESLSVTPEALSASRPDPDFTPNLLGYWPLDDLGGKVAVDASCLGHDGIVHGAAWTAGRLGTALDFRTPGDCVILPADCGLVDTNSFTLSFWYAPQPAPGKLPVIVKRGASGAGYALYASTQTSQWFLLVGDGTATHAIVLPQDVSSPAAGWRHVLVAVDRQQQRVRLFRDLKCQADVALPTLNGSLDTAAPLLLGAAADGSSLLGHLDDVRIYTGLLAPSGIADVYGKAANYPRSSSGTTLFIQ